MGYVVPQFLLPAGLDLPEMFPAADTLSLLYAAMLVSIIAERRCHTVGNKRAKAKFVRLRYHPNPTRPDKFNLLAYIPQNQLADALTMLTAFGVIEVSRSYSAGRFPQGYRLMPAWNARPIERQTFGDGWRADRVGRKLELARRHNLKPILPIHPVLIDHLYKLEMPMSAAHQIAATVGEDSLPFYNAVIAMIGYRQPIFKPDRSGRCHTSYSICPKKLRKLVRYDGQELVQVDMSSAQAFFLAQLALTHAENATKFLQSIHSITNYLPISFIPMSNNCWGVGKFLDLVCRDAWYDVWQSAGKYADRSKAKKRFVAMLNDTDPRSYYTAERDTFRKLCPVLADYYEAFWGLTIGGKSLLSRLLQAEEAAYVMDVCERLNAARPGMPILTVHDCIATTAEHVDFVREVMTAAAIDRWGRSPHFKKE